MSSGSSALITSSLRLGEETYHRLSTFEKVDILLGGSACPSSVGSRHPRRSPPRRSRDLPSRCALPFSRGSPPGGSGLVTGCRASSSRRRGSRSAVPSYVRRDRKSVVEGK